MPTTNLLYETVDYKIDKSKYGVWKSHLNFDGCLFREFTSNARVFGLPFLHITVGRDPQTGRRKIARGFFAFGRIAIGVFPIGQLAIGFIPIGQASSGLLFGIGQLATGIVAIGQAAISIIFGAGQFATGFLSVGQITLGYYSIAQFAFARHRIVPGYADPAVKAFIHRVFRISL